MVKLVVLVDFYDLEDTGYTMCAVEEDLQIVFTDSLFDLQSLYLYGLFALAIYFTATWAMSTSSEVTKTKTRKTVNVVKSGAEIVNPGEPDMSWIPDHVKQQEKKTRKRK